MENFEVKVKPIPQEQLDNPGELHPTKDGLLRVTKDNAPLASAMFLSQIRNSYVRIENMLNAYLKRQEEINNKLLTIVDPIAKKRTKKTTVTPRKKKNG